MSTEIPTLVSAYLSGTWNGGKASGGVILDHATGTTPAGWGQGDPLQYVMVYDRKDPMSGPVFQANAPDSGTVPSGLSSYLTTDYLMFWITAAFCARMPQGDLYDMLNQNGGGGKLQQMELLATKMACGVNAQMVYMLASIPGAGLQGLEFLEIQTECVANGNSTYKTAPYQMLLTLLPAANGLYSPVEMSG